MTGSTVPFAELYEEDAEDDVVRFLTMDNRNPGAVIGSLERGRANLRTARPVFPRELWEGRVGELLTTVPLDVDDLLGELDDPAGEAFEGLPDGTTVGHTHLRVADVPSTIGFYRDALGIPLMAALRDLAAFHGWDRRSAKGGAA